MQTGEIIGYVLIAIVALAFLSMLFFSSSTKRKEKKEEEKKKKENNQKTLEVEEPPKKDNLISATIKKETSYKNDYEEKARQVELKHLSELNFDMDGRYNKEGPDSLKRTQTEILNASEDEKKEAKLKERVQNELNPNKEDKTIKKDIQNLPPKEKAIIYTELLKPKF